MRKQEVRPQHVLLSMVVNLPQVLVSLHVKIKDVLPVLNVLLKMNLSQT